MYVLSFSHFAKTETVEDKVQYQQLSVKTFTKNFFFISFFFVFLSFLLSFFISFLLSFFLPRKAKVWHDLSMCAENEPYSA